MMGLETVCEKEGKHQNAISEVLIDGELIQLTCPRCGEFVVMTKRDFIKAIVDALTWSGKYTDVELQSEGK